MSAARGIWSDPGCDRFGVTHTCSYTHSSHSHLLIRTYPLYTFTPTHTYTLCTYHSHPLIRTHPYTHSPHTHPLMHTHPLYTLTATHTHTLCTDSCPLICTHTLHTPHTHTAHTHTSHTRSHSQTLTCVYTHDTKHKAVDWRTALGNVCTGIPSGVTTRNPLCARPGRGKPLRRKAKIAGGAELKASPSSPPRDWAPRSTGMQPPPQTHQTAPVRHPACKGALFPPTVVLFF